LVSTLDFQVQRFRIRLPTRHYLTTSKIIMKLHIDVETFSSVDIKTSGAYKYIESIDFEILMISYCLDHGQIQTIDLASGEKIPETFKELFYNPKIEKHAHNAVFERLAFRAIGMDLPVDQWHCSAIKAAYCGLPLSLDNVSKALNLGDKGKLATGKALIRYFSCPIKPTNVNGHRERNLPEHNPEKWEEFKLYCEQDVEAERTITSILEKYEMPIFERVNYLIDQEINDRGILIDLNLARNAVEIDNLFADELTLEIKKITGLDNPNSPAQLKNWLSQRMGKEITSLTKDSVNLLIREAGPGTVSDVLNIRKKLSKTSTKKYVAMLACACDDERAHGVFQFYGANRTGRWAGRLIQLQNLPRNYIKFLDLAREVVSDNDFDLMKILFDDLSDILSQLIRTAFIARKGKTFAVSDFSAIEARVLAWLAEETWRIEVFKTHGKIYEASAAMMFGVPIESIKKGSELRDKGKIAELALGYQGALGALTSMGGEKMGLSVPEMELIVKKWRDANPSTVKFWYDVERCAKLAIKSKKPVKTKTGNLTFNCDEMVMTIELPSGKRLYYQEPTIGLNRFGKESIKYKGIDQTTGQWVNIETYGGKLTENIVQAVSRDLLAQSMINLQEKGFEIVMHVHDEVACEVPIEDAEKQLEIMCELMCTNIHWAKGLPLNADGYVTQYYKKD